MRTQARAVVIGGGAVGCGIAYHLAKAGWSTVLLERDELTSGSTWHAAGLLPLFNMGYATSHIHDYSVKLYKTLEAETGLNAGFSVVGNLRMAQTRARMDEFELYAATAETVGIPYEWLTPAQIRDRWPLVRTEDLKGALFHPTDGYINPADVTQAMAKGARQRGVEIVRKAQVDALRLDRVGVDRLRPRAWSSAAATSSPARRPSRSAPSMSSPPPATTPSAPRACSGSRSPAIPVEHQYIVTEPDPALVEWRSANPEHPVLRDADAKWYVREERGGWILGPYENGAPARFEYARARQLPRRPLPARPRAHRGRVHVDDPPHPVLRERRASRTTSTARSATRPTATRWSARRRACATCGWPRASPSASPPPAGPATTSRR